MQWLIEQTGETMSSVGPGAACAWRPGSSPAPATSSSSARRIASSWSPGRPRPRRCELEDAAEAGEVLVSAATAAALDPTWLGGERDGARLLGWPRPRGAGRACASATSRSPDVDLERVRPDAAARHLAVEAGEGEHRQRTVAFVKFSGVGRAARARGLDGARSSGSSGSARSSADAGGRARRSRGSSPTSTSTAASSTSPPARRRARASDEERMLRALRAILDDERGLPLRAGVNRGPVVRRRHRRSARGARTRSWATPSTSRRGSTGRAEPGQILATGGRARPLAHALRDELAAVPRQGQGARRSPPTASARSSGVREDERAERAAARRARARARGAAARQSTRRACARAQLVELVGEPGIGKTRLVEELTALALGFTQLVARCERTRRRTPYFAFRAAAAAARGDHARAAEREEAGAQLAPWVQAVMPDLAPWLPLLAVPFDAQVEPTPGGGRPRRRLPAATGCTRRSSSS